jgi:hypothetical protein
MTPMTEGYHPEVDDSSLCMKDYSVECRSIIGCCIWIILLNTFDMVHAISVTNRFKMLPRERHLLAVERILSCLKTFPEKRIIIDASFPDHSVYPVEDHSNWVKFYQDSGEEIPCTRRSCT